jgi:hypothetical protein
MISSSSRNRCERSFWHNKSNDSLSVWHLLFACRSQALTCTIPGCGDSAMKWEPFGVSESTHTNLEARKPEAIFTGVAPLHRAPPNTASAIWQGMLVFCPLPAFKTLYRRLSSPLFESFLERIGNGHVEWLNGVDGMCRKDRHSSPELYQKLRVVIRLKRVRGLLTMRSASRPPNLSCQLMGKAAIYDPNRRAKQLHNSM